MSTGFGVAPNTPYWLISEERSFPLAPGSYVIGRSVEAEISFPKDGMMSRRHARLNVTPGGVEVEDLGSSNGTWVGGQQIQHGVVLREGAVLGIGAQSFTLRRMHTAQRRERAATSPDLPSYRSLAPLEDANDPEVSTQQGSPVDMVYAQAMTYLDVGEAEQARKLVEPLLDVLGRSEPRVGPRAIARASLLALRLSVATRDGRHADWALEHHRLHRAVLDARCIGLLENVIASRISIDVAIATSSLAELSAVAERMTESERSIHARIDAALQNALR
jgi:pSer/pThr/pTyr-binding forkhead associated (FHA) protein